MYTANNYNNSNYKGNNLANVAAYNWNRTGQNTWSESNLNKVNLNTNFINNIGTEWASKIAETTWKVGGNTWANIDNQPAKTAYQNEIVSPVTTNTTDNVTEYKAKIGLMYASDYGFAAAPSAWKTTLRNYTKSLPNWMCIAIDEWTITRVSNDQDSAFFLDKNGGIGNSYGYMKYSNKVRPVFYLTSSVTYASGEGTKSSPIRLSD